MISSEEILDTALMARLFGNKNDTQELTEQPPECAPPPAPVPVKEKSPSFLPYRQELKHCSLKDFVFNVLQYSFGMGHDYAFNDENGKPLKSWFTVQEAVEAAQARGYSLLDTQAQAYLDILLSKKFEGIPYFEKREELSGVQYRRCVFVYMIKL